MTDWAAELWQLRFPRGLRIPDPGPCLAALGEQELERLLRSFGAPPTSDGGGAEPTPALPRQLAARLGNCVWALRKQAERLDDDPAGRAVRGKVDLLDQILQSHDIEIVDYSGRDYDHRDIWDKVAESEKPKVHPYIAAMREPRILYRGDMIQAGTPIVEDREPRATHGERA